MEGLSCLLEEDSSVKPSISDILLLHLVLQYHDESYSKTVKYRDALRWPFNVDEDHESLLAQMTDSPYRSSAWTRRNPEPIFPIKRFDITHEDNDANSLIDSEIEDSEVEDLTEKKPSPWTPLQHSPILYDAIIQRIAAKTDANLDPILKRTTALGIMRKLETLLERTRQFQENLPTVKTPLDVPFVLNISKTILSEEQVSRIQDRYQSVLTHLHDHL